MIEPSPLAPRRIPRSTRYCIAAGLGGLAAVGLSVLTIQTHGSGTAVVVLMFALSIVLIFAVLVGMNSGFKPRLRGQHLEATTVLGRQSLDLAALSGARWERTRSGSMLVLRDPVTEIMLSLPVGASVHGAIRESVVAACQRGVVLPRKVTGYFGLPSTPGAPRSGASVAPWLLGAVFGLAFAGGFVRLSQQQVSAV